MGFYFQTGVGGECEEKKIHSNEKVTSCAHLFDLEKLIFYLVGFAVNEAEFLAIMTGDT